MKRLMLLLLTLTMLGCAFAEEAAEEPPAPDSPSGYGYVAAPMVNLRTAPADGAWRLAVLYRYALCQVQETEKNDGEDWCRVTVGEREGWLLTKHLMQLTRAELAEFLESEAYQEGLRNNAPEAS